MDNLPLFLLALTVITGFALLRLRFYTGMEWGETIVACITMVIALMYIYYKDLDSLSIFISIVFAVIVYILYVFYKKRRK